MATHNYCSKPRNVTWGLLLVGFVALTFLGGASLFASGRNTAIPLERLRGVDTILISLNRGPGQQHMASHFSGKMHPINPVFETMKKAFKEHPSINILTLNELPPDLRFKPNVLEVLFNLSAREDIFNEQKIKVASLSVRMSIFNQPNNAAEMPSSVIVSYPFIISEKREQFHAQLAEGVRLLTNYLPPYISCINTEQSVTNPNPCGAIHDIKLWWD